MTEYDETTRELAIEVMDTYLGTILPKYNGNTWFGGSVALIQFTYDRLIEYKDRLKKEAPDFELSSDQERELAEDLNQCKDTYEKCRAWWLKQSGKDLGPIDELQVRPAPKTKD